MRKKRGGNLAGKRLGYYTEFEVAQRLTFPLAPFASKKSTRIYSDRATPAEKKEENLIIVERQKD